MNKNYILSIILFGIISCKVNNPKGVWINIKNKPLTSENGYFHSSERAIIDFNKLESYRLSMPVDSVIKFLIDYKSKAIFKEGKTIKFNYSLFGKDSLEIYFEEKNLTEVYTPLSLDKKLSISKNEIINRLTSQQYYTAKDTLKIEFSNAFCKEEYFTKGIRDKRILTTKYLENKEFIGYWYIGEKNENYFLIINFDLDEEFIYQITEFEEKGIILKGILTKGFLSRIRELKTSL